MKYAEDDYMSLDLLGISEGEIRVLEDKMITGKKEHACFTFDGNQDHKILKGERHRKMKALVDSDSFFTYRMCLSCMDKELHHDYMEDGGHQDED